MNGSKQTRKTKQREAVLQMLSEKPQSAQELYSLLQQRDVKIDLASVYRSLEYFVNEGCAAIVDFGDGTKRYEKHIRGHHHHHIVCKQCGKVEDISIDEKKLLNEIITKTTFRVEDHQLEFFGTCKNCLS